MNVVQTPPVEIALRTLSEEDRRKVVVWLNYLANWETDSFIRQRAQKLPSSDNVYVLKTSNDLSIFFRLEPKRIVVLDLATEATLSTFRPLSETGR
jgi:hypothetical protein